jgi:acetyl esterase/lipase
MNNSKKEEKKAKKIIDLFNIKRNLIFSVIIFLCSTLLLKFQFHFNLFISIILSLLIIILLIILLLRQFRKRLNKAGKEESWHDLFGQKITNIPYYKNNIIINSFKKNGDNYKEEIGEVYDGKDYPKNERNYYDIFIPYSSLKNKNGINRIILFIHGGAWIHGKK